MFPAELDPALEGRPLEGRPLEGRPVESRPLEGRVLGGREPDGAIIKRAAAPTAADVLTDAQPVRFSIFGSEASSAKRRRSDEVGREAGEDGDADAVRVGYGDVLCLGDDLASGEASRLSVLLT